MSQVFFTSDLHIGHRNILEFARPQFSDLREMHEYIQDTWNSTVTKRDLCYVLGDVIFDKEYDFVLDGLNGTKKLVLGNHDKFGVDYYSKWFAKIHGMCFYKGTAILSHMPCHPCNLEFRAELNLHGHIHDPKKNVQDWRYFNLCLDCVPFMKPRSWTEIMEEFNERKKNSS